MALFDPYEVLDVERDATDAEIKAAHRKRAKDAHPDKGGNESEFRRVQHAWVILKDKKRREHYDATGDDESWEPNNSSPEMQAQSLVASLLMEIISHDGFTFDRDLVADMRSGLHRYQDELSKKRSHMRSTVDRIEKAKPKFSNTDGENKLDAMLDWLLRETRKQLIAVERNQIICQHARDFLASYEFERDETPLREARPVHDYKDAMAFFKQHFASMG